MCKQAPAQDTLVQLRPRASLIGRSDLGVEIDAEIAALLAADAPVAVGVSGGKDSVVAAIAVWEHLDKIGHCGTRILVHADLGDERPELDIEWADSLATCERLATHLRRYAMVELVVVKRAAGGMVKRWQKRWENNLKRYSELSCVKVILPWSTPSMRFCTSELKSAPIAAYLKKRWPGMAIVSACGIRRQEGNGKTSNPRTNAPTSSDNKRAKDSHGTTIRDWNPIAAYSTEDVFATAAARGFEMHEGYTKYDMTRISCRFCIMQSEDDQVRSANVSGHAPVLGTLVELEGTSGFAFQGSRWLADVAPAQLSAAQRAAAARGKEIAAQRKAIEMRIPKHLLYTKGWPRVMPTWDEAVNLADVRIQVAALYGIAVKYTTPETILARYAELMAENARREAKKGKRREMSARDDWEAWKQQERDRQRRNPEERLKRLAERPFDPEVELAVMDAAREARERIRHPMKEWPGDGSAAHFEDLVDPLARWLRGYENPNIRNMGQVPRYDGYPIGEHEAAGALQPDQALTLESLRYNIVHQGRDVYDVVIGLAIQIGIEQGRRMKAGS